MCIVGTGFSTEIRLRAERRIGEMLRERGEMRGGSKSHRVTLPDGIGRMDSSRWQRIAELDNPGEGKGKRTDLATSYHEDTKLTRIERLRCRQLAKVPAAALDEYLREAARYANEIRIRASRLINSARA